VKCISGRQQKTVELVEISNHYGSYLKEGYDFAIVKAAIVDKDVDAVNIV
jgi:hypothetical protein